MEMVSLLNSSFFVLGLSKLSNFLIARQVLHSETKQGLLYLFFRLMHKMDMPVNPHPSVDSLTPGSPIPRKVLTHTELQSLTSAFRQPFRQPKPGAGNRKRLPCGTGVPPYPIAEAPGSPRGPHQIEWPEFLSYALSVSDWVSVRHIWLLTSGEH